MPVVISESRTYDHTTTVSHPPALSIGLKHHWGFDENAKYQRVGAGVRRYLSTKGGPVAGMKFAITGTPVCKIVDLDMSWRGPGGVIGYVGIEGVTPGTGGKLELQDASGRTVDAIDLEVRNWRPIKARFYNLIDGVGHQAVSMPSGVVPASFTPLALAELVAQVNRIVLYQADIGLFPSGNGALSDLNGVMNSNFGDTVDINNVNIFSFTSGMGRDPDADYHVIFVWRLPPGDRGITMGPVTLLDANLRDNDRPLSLAHEFVHFLSVTSGPHHDDQSRDNLMFTFFPHGINMRKSRLQHIP